MRKQRKILVRHTLTWGELPDVMDAIAVKADQTAELQRKIAAMHRGLADDIRARLREAQRP